MSRAPRYWDSDCFLGWLLAEPDKAGLCRSVLENAEEGGILLVTSALTLAEVLMLKGKLPIPASDRDTVEQFFRSDYIMVRNVTRRVSELARSLVWDYRIHPKDAIHVATAIESKLKLMNTFDKKLISRSKPLLKTYDLTVEKPIIDEPKNPFSGRRLCHLQKHNPNTTASWKPPARSAPTRTWRRSGPSWV